MRKLFAGGIAAIIALSLMLSGCGHKAKTVGEFVLAETPAPEIAAQAEAITAGFLKCYNENDAAGALSLFSSDFNATEEDVASFFAGLKKAAPNPFVPFDSYYMNGLTVSENIIKVKKNEGDKNYIELAPADKELYLALFASEGAADSYMLSLLLAKDGGEFKIAFVNPGIMKYNGAAAPEIFEKTRSFYNDGKLISAYISSCMLGNVLRPGGYFRYENDIEMEDMCYKLFTEISEKYKLPLVLSGTTGSSVHEIGIADDAEKGTIPLFLVETAVPISDSAALEAECGKIIDALEALSPGLREGFDFAKFEATNDSSASSTESKTVVIALK